ncbi:hypothetical protein Tco_0667333 [Tanacetum coccineum]
MSSYNHPGFSCCGGPFNGGNCPSCSSVGSGNEFVYDPNPYSYNKTSNFFNQPPHHQYETYSCEFCGNIAHYGYDCPPQVPFHACGRKQHQPDDIQDLLHKLLKDVQVISEELADYINTLNWNRPAFYEDVDEEYTIAITPVLPTEEPDNFLSMGDEHLSTIPETESDEFIKSSVENLVQNPRESEDECECDVPDCDDSQTTNFSTFSNPLFDDSTSSDDESSHEEFAGELITIPPRIVNREHEEYISLMERLLYDNSSPRPPEDFHANPNTIIESLPTFPIPVEDSNSLREEIDIFPGPDDSIPPGIESDNYDSEGDDNSTSLPEFESFHVDYPDSGDSTIDVVEDIPVDVPNIFPTHPTLHMDFDFIPSHNDLGSDLDVSSPSGDRNKIYDPGICIEVESTRFLATLSPMIDTLLPFSFENEDKVFNHGVLASKEKSPPSSSHRGFKASKLFHHKSPMLIYGEDIPILDVPIAPDYEASRAHGFVLRSLELQSLA